MFARVNEKMGKQDPINHSISPHFLSHVVFVPRSLPLCIVSLTSFVFEHSACIVSTVNRRSEVRTHEMSLTNQFKPKIIDRKNRNPGTIPEGSVCSVRNRNPRISESAIFETQFLFPVVLEITCHRTETLMNALPYHQQNQLFAIFTIDRVRTDFWIQNSRLFRDFFSKTIISFSRLQVIKQVINTDLKKRRNKDFSRCSENVWTRLNKI